jgi:4-amino-4-deoxy-L-arabinose transferase-like glycosyltransferase
MVSARDTIPSDRSRPRPRDLTLVAAAAFVPRLLVGLATLDGGLFADMSEYDVRAHQILEDGTVHDAWRGPGYPAFLAAVYALPWADIPAARLANAPMGALMAALTTVLGGALVGRRAAVAAGLIVAFYPGLVLSSAYLMPEPLYTSLMLASLIAGSRVTHARAVAAGVLAGLAALTRSLGLSLVPALAIGSVWPLWRAAAWRQRLAPVAIVALSFGLTLAPWLWHTTRVAGGPMLDSSSAFNMLAGHNPRATGRLEIADLPWMLETYLLGYPDEATRNTWAMQHSLQWATSNVGAWLRLVPLKVGYLWGLEGREHAWLYTHGGFGARRPAVVWAWGAALLVSFPLLAVAAVLGMCRPGLSASTPARQFVALLAIVTVLHIASFGESRYHLPLVPLLAVLAMRGAAHGPVRGRARVVAILLIGLLAAAWIVQAPELLNRLARLAQPDGWRSGLPY